ncbi:MAG TPA: DedA family protein [Acidocella sp.]|nr:DedA family protein [Acidocella sp.]
MLSAEGFGLFFLPGETTLIIAAFDAGATGNLNIVVLIVIAFLGAITGDNFAYLIGHRYGFKLLRRYGHIIGVHEKRIKFMQYLFLRYGNPIVFIGRFVLFLRSWESFLAGADAMPYRRFLPVNALASLLWVCVWGLGAYGLGEASTQLLEWIGIAIFVVVVIALFFGWRHFHQHEEEFEAIADEALPGPLQPHRTSDLHPTRSQRI